jgi:hypothetical protein
MHLYLNINFIRLPFAGNYRKMEKLITILFIVTTISNVIEGQFGLGQNAQLGPVSGNSGLNSGAGAKNCGIGLVTNSCIYSSY